jgi:hypothetical protein
MNRLLALSAAALAAVILLPGAGRAEQKGLFGSKPLVAKPAAADHETTASAAKAGAKTEQGSKVIVYYFHGKARCPSCIKIETWSADAVKAGFASQLGEGTIEWRVVDTDEPGNEHFMKDYGLYTKSVVLVEIRNGKQQRYRNLEKVWELLGSQKAFGDYIKSEVAVFAGVK